MAQRSSRGSGATLGLSILGASCAVDTTDVASSGIGGGATTSSATTSSSSDSSSSAAGVGGAGGGAGVGGGGGGADCPFTVIAGVLAECTNPGPLSLSTSGTTLCPADTSVEWPAKVYSASVTAGACLHMRADNAGSAGADLFGAIVDPSGRSLLFDEEMDCTVANPNGYKCPSGGAVIETSGIAYVVVGSWEGLGCPAGDPTPFQLSVSSDGVDVPLGGELCAGDLQQIIR